MTTSKKKVAISKSKPKSKSPPKPKKPKYDYVLDITYPADRYPTGDNKIAEVIGDDSGGSGCGFGVRDIAYCYPTKAKALKARDKVLAIKFPGLTASVFEQNWGIDHCVEIE